MNTGSVSMHAKYSESANSAARIQRCPVNAALRVYHYRRNADGFQASLYGWITDVLRHPDRGGYSPGSGLK